MVLIHPDKYGSIKKSGALSRQEDDPINQLPQENNLPTRVPHEVDPTRRPRKYAPNEVMIKFLRGKTEALIVESRRLIDQTRRILSQL